MKNALYDLSLLAEYANDDDDAIAQMLDVFYVSFDEALAELTAQMTDGENPHWSKAAHKLKGAAGYVGATSLRQLCATAQDMQNASRTARRALHNDIAVQYDALSRALRSRTARGR